MWDAASGELLTTLVKDDPPDIDFSPDKKRRHAMFSTILFSPDGKKVMVADQHGRVLNWDYDYPNP